MTLSDLASLGSFINGVAVIVTLVFLLMQMRQTNRNQRAIMNQGVISRSTEITMWIAQPDIADLIARIAHDDVNFTRKEVFQAYSILRTFLLNVQDSYVQHKSGLTDDITFENSIAVIKTILGRKAFATIWDRSRTAYAAEFASFIDTLIAAQQAGGRPEFLALIESDFAAMKATAK